MPSWMDDLLAPIIRIAGTGLPQRKALNFVSGASAVDNPSTGSTDIMISAGGITPSNNDRRYLQEHPSGTVGLDRLTVEMLAKASLPSPAIAGRIFGVSDDCKGIAKDTGSAIIFLNGEHLNAKEYGIVADRLNISDAQMASGSNVLYSPSTDFTTLVGKSVSVDQVGDILLTKSDVATTSGSSIITSASTDFTTLVGKRIVIVGAGSEVLGGGKTGKHFTINSIGVDVNHAVLSANADATVSGATATIGLGAGMTGTITGPGSDSHHAVLSFTAAATVSGVGAVIGSGAANWTAYKALVTQAVTLGRPIFFPAGSYWILPPSPGTDTIALANGATLVQYGFTKYAVDILIAPGYVDSKVRSSHTGYNFIVFTVGDNTTCDFRSITWRGPSNSMPDDFNNGPVSTFWQAQDGSVSTLASFSDCDVRGRFTNVYYKAGGSTTGDFYLRISRSVLEACGQIVSVFTAEHANTWLICDDVDFLNAGLVADQTWANGPHSIYVHPPVNQVMKRCRWTNAGFYAVHMFSGSGIGSSTTPHQILYESCWFGPGVTNGVLCSNALQAVSKFVGCTFEGHVGLNADATTLVESCKFYGSSAGQLGMCCAFDPGINVFVNGFTIIGSSRFAMGIVAGKAYWALKSGLVDMGDTIVQNVFDSGADVEVHMDDLDVVGGHSTGQIAAAAISYGSWFLNNVRFRGQFGHFSQGAVNVLTGGSIGQVVIDGCTFDVAAGKALTVDAASAPLVEIRRPFYKQGMPSAGALLASGCQREGMSPTPIASAATLQLTQNYKGWKVSGTTDITDIQHHGDANAEFAAPAETEVVLYATGAWKTPGGGNIVPISTSARSVGARVVLRKSPVDSKYYEVAA